MDPNAPKETVPSGSSYRPYYSYAPDSGSPELPAAPEAVPVRADPVSSAPPMPSQSVPLQHPVQSVPSAAAAAPKKKGNSKTILVLLGILFVLFILVAAVYAAGLGSSGISSGNKVAVIHISGQMVTGDYMYGSGYAGSDSVSGYIRAAADNNSVKAIVLRIDSPGGTGSSSQEINAEIARVQAMGKPVVTSMGDMATSAAYYVASQTDYIYATPSTLTGSIGVYTVHYDYSEVYDESGIDVTMIKSGEMKDMGADFRPLTSDEKKYMQHVVNELFYVFVDDVAQGRNMSRADVLTLADGRYYTGTDAVENGLIDDFGNIYDAADKAAELAGLNSYSLYYVDNVTLSSLLF